MEALFKIKTEEIDKKFIDSLKKLFAGKDIVIRVYEEDEETAYLTKYPENEKHLLENIVSEPSRKFSGDEFNTYVKKIS
jgi:hypothetical protein